MILALMMVMTVSANAFIYKDARKEALFLSDKMAYELSLTTDQYEAVYEISLGSPFTTTINGASSSSTAPRRTRHTRVNMPTDRPTSMPTASTQSPFPLITTMLR